MNILLLGYGKMGHAIEKIAEERGHGITGRINEDNKDLLTIELAKKTDVVIEFSSPEAAYDNLSWCIKNNLPVVSGTTGWLDKRSNIEELCNKMEGTFFYASNFSIGVNIFFRINKQLAEIMEQNPDYDVSMEEVHHIHKKDSPSGTAITLAEDILNRISRKDEWKEGKGDKKVMEIKAEREDEIPGTHIVTYNSKIDKIEIKHEAHSRKGFAQGAVLVAEWVKNKKGVLGMDDFLSF